MSLSFHIDFDGRCEEAFAFYAEHLGGRIGTVLRVEDAPMAAPSGLQGRHVLHANIGFDGVELAGGDVAPERYRPPQGFCVLLGLASQQRVLDCFQALQAGGHALLAPQRTFWSPCYAIVVDRFGVPWRLNCGE